MLVCGGQTNDRVARIGRGDGNAALGNGGRVDGKARRVLNDRGGHAHHVIGQSHRALGDRLGSMELEVDGLTHPVPVDDGKVTVGRLGGDTVGNEVNAAFREPPVRRCGYIFREV